MDADKYAKLGDVLKVGAVVWGYRYRSLFDFRGDMLSGTLPMPRGEGRSTAIRILELLSVFKFTVVELPISDEGPDLSFDVTDRMGRTQRLSERIGDAFSHSEDWRSFDFILTGPEGLAAPYSLFLSREEATDSFKSGLCGVAEDIDLLISTMSDRRDAIRDAIEAF